MDTEITREQIEELCKRLERIIAGRPETFDNDLPANPDGQEAAALIRRLAAERDEALEERDIWRSVFPDIAPASVIPDRSLLESRATAAEGEVARLRAVLYVISCPTQTKNLLWWQIEARTALEDTPDGK